MYPQGGGGTGVTYFFLLVIHSFTSILIIVPLYRKFSDGHIIFAYDKLLNSYEIRRLKKKKESSFRIPDITPLKKV